MYKLLYVVMSVACQSVSEYLVPIDHFDVKQVNNTFPLRYYYNTTYQDAGQCRILFVLGGEGAANLGKMAPFVSERLAAEHRAGVLHSEHRFYGQSLREENFKNNLSLLTIDQALRDYAALLVHVMDGRSCEVVAVGGSYPGTLAILFRMMYPWLITAAYASSAPIKYLTNEAVETEYYQIVEATAKRANAACPTAVRRVLDQVLASERQSIVDELNLCASHEKFVNLQDELVQAVRVHFANLNMAAYPLGNSRLKKLCDQLVDPGNNGQSTLFDAVLNNTSEANGCKDFSRLAPADSATVTCSDVTGCGLDQDGLHWDWQACTEHVMLIGSGDAMFPRLVGDYVRLEQYCQKRFAVRPAGFRTGSLIFPGESVKNIAAVTGKILFVNGQNDGWTAGCIRESTGRDLVVVEIEDGAHHSEMGADKVGDTEEMKNVRKTISKIIGGFFSPKKGEEYLVDVLVA